MTNEQDITFRNNEPGKVDVNENSAAAINEKQPSEPDNYYYDEIDRKCTLRKSGTIGSKIVLHRTRTKYKGKRIFDISIALLGIIGIMLIVFYIIICARGGWSKSNLYDVNKGNKITLILVGIFVIFISCIGMLGSYTYWKPIILMTSLLCALALISHFYLAKKFMDITRFADRDMAIQWWDTYTDENIMAIEQEYGCCGYLNYKDHGFVTPNCPKELVIYEVPSDVHYVASVKKNDSYQRKFGTPENPKNVEDASVFNSPTATTEETTNGENGDYVDNGYYDNGNGYVDNGNGYADNGNVDNSYVDNGNGYVEGNNGGEEDYEDEGLWRKRAIKKRGLNVVEEKADDKEKLFEHLGEEIKSSLSSGQGKIIKAGGIHKKRYEPVFSRNRISRNVHKESITTPLSKRDEMDPNNNGVDLNELMNTIPGCRNAIVDKVKSGITPLYIILFACLIIYAIKWSDTTFNFIDNSISTTWNGIH